MAAAQMKLRVFLSVAFLGLLAGVHLWLVVTGTPSASQAERLYILRGHEGPITNLTFSPDSRLLATSSEDHAAKLWDLRSGRLERTLRGHTGTVGSVAFAPGSRALATGGAVGTVKLWDVASGRPLRSLPGVEGPLAFSPNGRLLATSDGNSVQLWDTRMWRITATVRPPLPPATPLRVSTAIAQLAFAPDGESLATVEGVSYYSGEPPSEADIVQLWYTASWHARRTLREPDQT